VGVNEKKKQQQRNPSVSFLLDNFVVSPFHTSNKIKRTDIEKVGMLYRE
jgi:hypothetical protein